MKKYFWGRLRRGVDEAVGAFANAIWEESRHDADVPVGYCGLLVIPILGLLKILQRIIGGGNASISPISAEILANPTQRTCLDKAMFERNRMPMVRLLKTLIAVFIAVSSVVSQAQFVALQPSGSQTVRQPTATTLMVNSLNSSLNPILFPGSDIGAQINSAISALPQSAFGEPCGTIVVPAGYYAFSTSIVKPQCVFIEGNGANLHFTATSGAALVVASPYSNSDPYSSGGVSHLSLSGVGGSSIGVYMGGDPAGSISRSDYYAADQSFVDDQIFGFGTGVQMGNNSFLDTWRGGAISSNNIGVYFPCGTTNAGENYSFYGMVVNNGGVGFKQDCGAEIKLYGGGVDYNVTAAITGAGIYVTAYGTHFEQRNAPIILGQGVSATQQLNLFGGVLYASAPGGDDPSFITIGGVSSNVRLDAVDLAAGPGHGVSSIVNWQAGGQGHLSASAITGATSPPLVIGATGNVSVSAMDLNTASLSNYSGAFIPSGLIQGGSYIGSANNSNGSLPGTSGTFPYNGTFLGWNADDNGGSDFYNAFDAPASANAAFNWWSNNNGAWSKISSLSRNGDLTLNGRVSATTVTISGANWTSGNGIPSGACTTGSLYSNKVGGPGSTLFICVAGAWVDDK